MKVLTENQAIRTITEDVTSADLFELRLTLGMAFAKRQSQNDDEARQMFIKKGFWKMFLRKWEHADQNWFQFLAENEIRKSCFINYEFHIQSCLFKRRMPRQMVKHFQRPDDGDVQEPVLA